MTIGRLDLNPTKKRKGNEHHHHAKDQNLDIRVSNTKIKLTVSN